MLTRRAFLRTASMAGSGALLAACAPQAAAPSAPAAPAATATAIPTQVPIATPESVAPTAEPTVVPTAAPASTTSGGTLTFVSLPNLFFGDRADFAAGKNTCVAFNPGPTNLQPVNGLIDCSCIR